MSSLIVVTGAGGFIGGHLTSHLLRAGKRVRALDIKPVAEWFQLHGSAENVVADLRDPRACDDAVDGAAAVFNLASDMGGMGFIESNRARCMLSVLINTQLLRASRDARVQRFFFASSACVYPVHLQAQARATGLREDEAYPAMPEDGYGWEKLFSERMCSHFHADFGIETRVARYHNVYGPCGSWRGGREKAPAAICRKVAEAVISGKHEIEVWGDGRQTRTFLYIDDCIEGTLRLMSSDTREPVNIGSDERMSIDDLVDLVEELEGVKLRRRYRFDRPVGVRARSSDNTLARRNLAWEPRTALDVGLANTYRWVREQVTNHLRTQVDASGEEKPCGSP